MIFFPGKSLCHLASESQCPPRGRSILLSEEKSHHSRLPIPWCFSGWRNLLESHICPLPWASQDAVSWGPAPFHGRSPLLIQKRSDASPSFCRSPQTSLAPGVVKGGDIQSAHTVRSFWFLVLLKGFRCTRHWGSLGRVGYFYLSLDWCLLSCRESLLFFAVWLIFFQEQQKFWVWDRCFSFIHIGITVIITIIILD